MRRTKDQGLIATLFKIISVPLAFLRDITCPMVETESWNKFRALILPLTIPFSFAFLTGKFDLNTKDYREVQKTKFYTDTCLILLIPGAFVSSYILLKTNRNKPPAYLMNIFVFLSFVMSISWISFTSDCIIDLLKLFGFITHVPGSLLALTILSWGNCLGDASTNIAMTKKGFGEMAITGTLAGPIFNILVG